MRRGSILYSKSYKTLKTLEHSRRQTDIFIAVDMANCRNKHSGDLQHDFNSAHANSSLV